jgi:hypothetical protein
MASNVCSIEEPILSVDVAAADFLEPDLPRDVRAVCELVSGWLGATDGRVSVTGAIDLYGHMFEDTAADRESPFLAIAEH